MDKGRQLDKVKQWFHVVSYLQYPLMLVGLGYMVYPYIAGFDRFWSAVNSSLVFFGLAISFSTLQDTRKTQNNFSKKIWENSRKGMIALVAIAVTTALFLVLGMVGFLMTQPGIIKEVSFGTLMLGLGYVGLLKSAVEMHEHHRLPTDEALPGQTGPEPSRDIGSAGTRPHHLDTPQEEAPMSEHDDTARAPDAGGPPTEVATLAGGCFWGVEEILRAVPGVLDTDVGYTGGWLENPTYDDTHDSKSGHAEAIRVTFDPAVLSYEELLENWFFKLHDPTTLNRQGNDIGTQYRSALFPNTPEQKATAEAVIARVNASGKWKQPVTTSIEPVATWYSAESYHQDYLRKHPGGYSCHFMRD